MRHRSIPLRVFLTSILACLLVFVSSLTATAQTATFTMSESLLRTMIQRNTIQPEFRVRMTARPATHSRERLRDAHRRESTERVPWYPLGHRG